MYVAYADRNMVDHFPYFPLLQFSPSPSSSANPESRALFVLDVFSLNTFFVITAFFPHPDMKNYFLNYSDFSFF